MAGSSVEASDAYFLGPIYASPDAFLSAPWGEKKGAKIDRDTFKAADLFVQIHGLESSHHAGVTRA